MEMMNPSQQQFVEDVARTFEQMFGLSRTAGRLWGVLLICDQEQLSVEELMECVGASRGSVSTLARMLEGIGLIERVAVRGDRKHYYRASDAQRLIQAELSSIKTFSRLMESGLRASGKGHARARSRIADYLDLMQFFSDEYAALTARWIKKKEQK